MTRKIPTYRTPTDDSYREELNKHIADQLNNQSALEIVSGFAKYAPRQDLTRFLARVDIFRMIKNTRGCIAELGVNSGHGLMAWAHLSAILEPIGGMFRHIYGFDTFDGFPSVHDKDKLSGTDFQWKENDLSSNSFEDLQKCVKLFDQNRTLGQIPKVSLIKGDFNVTAEKFLVENQHVVKVVGKMITMTTQI